MYKQMYAQKLMQHAKETGLAYPTEGVQAAMSGVVVNVQSTVTVPAGTTSEQADYLRKANNAAAQDAWTRQARATAGNMK
jgi:hypothetical protein